MKNSKALQRFTLIPMLAALAAVISPSVQAQSLVDLYGAARSYDATFQSAKSNADATAARAEQAKAGILPSAALTANANRTNTEAVSKLEQAYGVSDELPKDPAQRPLRRGARRWPLRSQTRDALRLGGGLGRGIADEARRDDPRGPVCA